METVDSSFGRSKMDNKSAVSFTEALFRVLRSSEKLKPFLPDLKVSNVLLEDIPKFHFEKVLRKLRGKLFGDKYERDCVLKIKFESRMEKEVFYDDLKSVEELKDFMLTMRRVFLFIIVANTPESTTRSLEFSNLSISEGFRSLILNAVESQNWGFVETLIMPIAAALYRPANAYHAVAALIALLLVLVYLYLLTLVAVGGGKACSSGSFEFRSIYISIVLFLGAYVWIKFRDVAPDSLRKPSPGLYRRFKLNESGHKVYYGPFEPRFKPLGSKNYISVGSYELEVNAKNMYRILAFYHGKDDGLLTLPNGVLYRIPHMTEGEQFRFFGPDLEERKKCVIEKAKAIYEECVVLGSFDWESQQDAGIADVFKEAGGGLESMPGSDWIGVNKVTQETQHDVANDTLSGRVGGDASHVTESESTEPVPAIETANGAGASLPTDKQPLVPHLQQASLHENQANNSLIPDELSLRRQLRELQGQVQLVQSRLQRQESRFQQQESRFQLQESRFQQQESRFQLQEARYQEQEAQISELQDEVERLRSTEHACKRRCTERLYCENELTSRNLMS